MWINIAWSCMNTSGAAGYAINTQSEVSKMTTNIFDMRVQPQAAPTWLQPHTWVSLGTFSFRFSHGGTSKSSNNIRQCSYIFVLKLIVLGIPPHFKNPFFFTPLSGSRPFQLYAPQGMAGLASCQGTQVMGGRSWKCFPSTVGKTIINHPFGHGFYHLFMVIWGWFVIDLSTLVE